MLKITLITERGWFMSNLTDFQYSIGNLKNDLSEPKFWGNWRVVKPFQNDWANQTWSNDSHFALVLTLFLKNDRKSYLGPQTVENFFFEPNLQQPWDTLYAPKISILYSQVSKNIQN